MPSLSSKLLIVASPSRYTRVLDQRLSDSSLDQKDQSIPPPEVTGCTYPFESPITLSLMKASFPGKDETRNQDVWVSVFGPDEVATTYFMISVPLLVVIASGSLPRRPTIVMRASCEGRDVEKVRVRIVEEERSGTAVDLRKGERRTDMFRGWGGRRAVIVVSGSRRIDGLQETA